jgi:YggT family protein
VIRTIFWDLDRAYTAVVFVYILLSWFPMTPGGAVVQVRSVLGRVVEPVLTPLRRVLPPVRMGGMGLDLSPIILFFVLLFVVPQLIHA